MTTISEAFFDREQEMNNDGSYTSVDLIYFVFDADNEEEAFDFVYAGTGATYEGVQRSAISLEERINETTWKFKITYKTTSSGSSGGTIPSSTFTFDTTGGTEHVTQALSTAGYPAGYPDRDNCIGWDGKTVNGVDLVKPVYNFTETHYFTNSQIDEAYTQDLALLTGTYNHRSFRGFDAGEVLFLGARGGRQSTDSDALWEITFHFAQSYNEEFSFEIGSVTVLSKLGWDYIDVFYEEQVDGTAFSVIAVPKYVYVHKVYDESDFDLLNI